MNHAMTQPVAEGKNRRGGEVLHQKEDDKDCHFEYLYTCHLVQFYGHLNLHLDTFFTLCQSFFTFLRRVLAQQRDVEQPRNFTLVNEGTASLGNQVWKSFQRWLASDFSSAAVSSLQRSGEVLGLLVVEFGRYLYASGQSIYLMRQLVTHIQRVDPPKRPHLYEAWRLISNGNPLNQLCIALQCPS